MASIALMQDIDMKKYSRQMRNGFSLMELMIVVAIISIIAAIAYPAYARYAQRSNRTDGTVALSQASQQLERCFTTFNQYNSPNCSVAATLNGVGMTSNARFYTITGVFLADGSGYTLTATPVLAPQTSDTDCPTITLDNTGARDPADCW